MLARTHVLISGITWGALWWRPLEMAFAAPLMTLGGEVPYATDTSFQVTLSLAVVGLGALLPDLDHPRARLARWRLGRRGSLLGLIRPLAWPAAVLHEEFGHRGLLHSALAAAAISAGAEILGQHLAVAGLGWVLAWGYAWHLLADAATSRGIPLFLPFSRVRLRLPGPLAVRTGGLGEALSLIVIAALAAFYATGDLW